MMGGTGDSSGGNPNDSAFSSDDLAKATGLPSLVTDILLGKKASPPTQKEIRMTQVWRVVHVLFALLIGLYLQYVNTRSTATFGANPPAPATIQNPFNIFVLGELVIQGAQAVILRPMSKRGLWTWLQILRDIGYDGSVVIFVMGVAVWWAGPS